MIIKRTSSITFRIAESYEKALRKVAEEKKISLNTLANQIFGNYVELERYMAKFGVLVMSKDTFKLLLSAMSEKDLINLAVRAGSEEPKEFILFKWKTLNADNVIEFLKIYFEHCGYGTYDMERSDGNTALSVHHNLGEKGSLYLKSFVESVIQSTINQECESTITKDSLTIIFRE